MRYTHIQREDYDPIITIGEYILMTAPEVFMRLCGMMFTLRICQAIQRIHTVDVEDVDKFYERLMQERPKPGLGGLLPGEGVEALQ